MTGPEHHEEAERLVRVATALPPGAMHDGLVAVVLAEAQVHATLALAPQKAPRCDCMNVIGGGL